MTRRRWRYTAAASADIEQITRDTLALFGDAQALRYAQLIDRAASLAADDPMRASSRGFTEFGHGVRALHLSTVARRAGAAAHVLLYQYAGTDVLVLRVLHERMDPALHVSVADDEG